MKDVTTPCDGASWQPDTSQLAVPSIQPTQTPPRSRRKQTLLPGLTSLSPFLLLLVFASFLPLASAVFVNFKDCLTPIYLADGRQTPYLRFEPEYVWADFSPEYRLNVTVYGNVSGQAEVGDYPPLNDDNWKDPNKTFGKIVDLNDNHRHYTTLFWNNRVLPTLAIMRRPPASAIPSSTLAVRLLPLLRPTRVNIGPCRPLS